MNPLLHGLFEVRIKALVETEFQRFVDIIYVERYGAKYVPVRAKRDQGCDGILNQTTILSCYAPGSVDLAKFKKKVGDDFDKYTANWATKYRGWQVVHNNEFTAAMLQFIRGLKTDADPVGVARLLGLIDGLPWPSKKTLSAHLAIPEEQFSFDILQEVVDDLARPLPDAGPNPIYAEPKYITEKIALNYEESDIKSATDMYFECLRYFGILKEIMDGLLSDESAALRTRITRGYTERTGLFKERLQSIIRELSASRPHDDLYTFYVTTVLLYFFERCLIGEKTKAELGERPNPR
jgi:hypothetical protein